MPQFMKITPFYNHYNYCHTGIPGWLNVRQNAVFGQTPLTFDKTLFHGNKANEI